MPDADELFRAERPPRPADIFADALERDPEERAGFLRQVCMGAPGLLAEVESLLRAHERMEAEGAPRSKSASDGDQMRRRQG